MSSDRPATSETTAWAQLFAERSKNDELSRDYNIARGDRDAFQAAFSYLAGFVSGMSRTALGRGARRRLAQSIRTLSPLIDDVPFRQGMQEGLDLNVREERREGVRSANRWARTAMRYGIASVDELDAVLARHPAVPPAAGHDS